MYWHLDYPWEILAGTALPISSCQGGRDKCSSNWGPFSSVRFQFFSIGFLFFFFFPEIFSTLLKHSSLRTWQAKNARLVPTIYSTKDVVGTQWHVCDSCYIRERGKAFWVKNSFFQCDWLNSRCCLHIKLELLQTTLVATTFSETLWTSMSPDET